MSFRENLAALRAELGIGVEATNHDRARQSPLFDHRLSGSGTTSGIATNRKVARRSDANSDQEANFA